jgi:hypothetical protein
MNTSWHWAHVLWHWFEVVAIVVGFVAGIPVVLQSCRRFKEWWSLLSRQSAINRLPKLELELQTLNEPSALDEPRARFYNFVFLMLSVMSCGLMVAAWYVYINLAAQKPPSGLLAFVVVIFAVATAIGLGNGNYFAKYLPWTRVARKQEVERAIAAIKKKLEPPQ